MHRTKKYDMYALYVRVCACYIRMRVCVCVGVDTYTPHKHTYEGTTALGDARESLD